MTKPVRGSEAALTEEEIVTGPSLTSVLLASTEPDKLHAWYVAALAPQKDTEQNGVRILNYGGFNVVIDGRSDIRDTNPDPARMMLNFEVADARAATARLDDLGVKWIAELEDRGGSLFATAMDPDENYVQIIQFSDEARAALEGS